MAHEPINTVSAEPALEKLKSGNALYLQSQTDNGDISPQRRADTCGNGQHPYAIIITCSDSRVIPESVFSAGMSSYALGRIRWEPWA